MNVDQKLGLTIKKIREEKNLSQSELGKISGIERTTIVKLEKGEHSPSLKTIYAIAKALEMKTYELIKDSNLD